MSGSHPGAVTLLYSLAFFSLAGLSLFVSLKGHPSRRRLRFSFLGLSLSLLLWQATLFLEVRSTHPSWQLALGRANFSAVALAAFFALRFVREIPSTVKNPPLSTWLSVETVLLAGLALLTPLVSQSERVEAGRAVTTFGPLFPLYLLHVLALWTAALLAAFRERDRTENPREKGQLLLVGSGMLATGAVSLLSNAVLPYGYGDFRYSDLGTLSVLLFVGSVAYAAFLRGLFGLRVLVRKALVYGLLLAFVLGAYGSAVFLVTEYLTESSGKLVQFAVLLIAFSLDPLRKYLEERTSRLLFPRHSVTGSRRDRPSSERGGSWRLG